MSDRQGYYSVVQFLPSPDRLEFVNIGIVLFTPNVQNGVLVKVEPDINRIRKAFGRQDMRKFRLLYESLASRIYTEFSGGWSQSALSRFASMRSGNIQMSPPLPILIVGEPEDLIQSLLEEMVIHSPKQVRARRVASVVKKRLADAGVLDLVDERPAAIELPQGVTIKVPFAYQNGAYNLIDPIRLEGSTDEALKNASAKAVEGRWLAKHSEKLRSPKRLVVVGDMSDQPDNFSSALEEVMEVNEVKFYRLDDLQALIDDIRTHSHHSPSSASQH